MIILYCFLGAAIGIIAGLIPGLHSNNVAIMLAASPLFGIEATAFMLSLCITQSFTEIIPATYLGAPDTNTFEGVLPAHKLFLKGKAHEAVCLFVFGALIAVVLGIFLSPLFFLFIQQNEKTIFYGTPIVLISALVLMILGEQGKRKKIIALFIVISAGLQGMLFQDQVFPLITGYFALPGIIYSLKEKNLQIKQNEKVEINLNTIKEGLLGAIGGSIVAVLPGIGSNTAAGIIKTFTRKIKPEKYLALIGSISASNFFFSYSALFAIEKARNGAMIALQEKIFPTQQNFFAGILIMALAAGIGGLASIFLSGKASKIISEKKAQITTKVCLVLIIALVFVFNGFQGVIVLFFSSALGTLTLNSKTKRSLCMSSLIIPTLLFYFFIIF